jgi:hypothetical protein
MVKTGLVAIWAIVLLARCADGGKPAAQPAAVSSHATPSASQMMHSPSAAVIAHDIKAAGLPVAHLIVYTPKTDPNDEMGRQGGYTSKVAWQNPAIRSQAGPPSSDPGGVEFGGGIEVFANVDDARSRATYLAGFKPPFGDGYNYLKGTAVLRLSQYLTPAQARAYKAAFTKAVQG